MYERFLADTRDVLGTVHRWGLWQRKDASGPATTSCRDFPATDVHDAAETTLPIWYTSAPQLDPAAWPEVRAAVINVGYRFGFGRGLVRSDIPGNYLLTLINGTGASTEFGVGINATLSLSTGCHLTRAARERGRPRPGDHLRHPEPALRLPRSRRLDAQTVYRGGQAQPKLPSGCTRPR